MIVKYHLCIDNVIRTDEELNNTNTSSLINTTYLVNTDISKTLTDKQIKYLIFNYIYGNGQQPKWLSQNNLIWKGKY